MRTAASTRRVVAGVLLASALGAVGCADRTPVGDAGIEPRTPFRGGVYDECSEFNCARSCPGDAGTVRGECIWGADGLECRCVGRARASCDPAACTASCRDLGYDAALCDAIGCRCYHVPTVDAGDEDAGDALD